MSLSPTRDMQVIHQVLNTLEHSFLGDGLHAEGVLTLAGLQGTGWSPRALVDFTMSKYQHFGCICRMGSSLSIRARLGLGLTLKYTAFTAISIAPLVVSSTLLIFPLVLLPTHSLMVSVVPP